VQLIRFSKRGKPHLAAVVDGWAYDLERMGDPRFASISALLAAGMPPESIQRTISEWISGASPDFDGRTLMSAGLLDVDGEELRLLCPIDQQEVWASGVTYKRSEEARKAESQGAAAFYSKVYEAPRPELFFKATPHRTVGSHDAVGIRYDARWNVPEPELGLVLSNQLEIVGFTVGNDMSSRDIEGENPLYLPQAKVYDRSCALGPGITLASSIDPRRLAISLTIERDGRIVFWGETNTRAMKRDFSELVSYLGRSNSFPHGAVLLTGTGIVPAESFTLRVGDVITVTIDGIGSLVNTVVTVGAPDGFGGRS